MKLNIFSALYDWTLRWAKHKLAPYYLALLSFTESVIFPIPPDVLLAPMVLAKPEKAWTFATITTVASVLGGVLGYVLGSLMFEPWIQPIITELGYQHRFDLVMEWFMEWGIWVVFLAGFSPVPYKLFTVSAGLLHMAFIPFLIASAIGRGLRFFIVAGLIQWGGAAMEHNLRLWADRIGWALVALIIIAYFLFVN